jgi:integrase/recombinase XerD
MGRYPFITYAMRYLETVGGIYSDATVKELERRMRRMAKDLQSLKEQNVIDTCDPARMREKEVSTYLKLLRSRGLSDTGQRHNISALRSILLFCGNPVVDKMRIRYRQMFPTGRSRRYPPIEKKDIDKIHDRAETARDWRKLQAYALVVLALNSGLRTKELRLAQIGDLDRNTWTIVVRHPKGEGKYGQQRTVPILPRARKVIVRYLALRSEMVSKRMPTNEALFPALGDRGDGIFSNGKMLTLKGIVEAETGVTFDFRACRRSFGQMCLDNGADVESVSILLGHTTTKTTEGYYCRKRADVALKEVFEVFEPQKPQRAIKPLIENEKYLSGYA